MNMQDHYNCQHHSLYIIYNIGESNITTVTLSEHTDEKPPIDPKILGIILSLANIPLFAVAAVAVVSIGCYCCYRRKHRNKKDLTFIAEKAGLVILDDNQIRAKEEGRLIVNVSILDAGEVKITACCMHTCVFRQVDIQ